MSNLSSDPSADLREEQAHLDLLYRHLDELRIQARGSLTTARLESGGTLQALSQRDATTGHYAERLAHLDAVEHGLCFGRLDLQGDGDRLDLQDDGGRLDLQDDDGRVGETLHIGRIGMHDTGEPLLIDWRAPAARPFYVATAITPHGVTRRRHIRTRFRQVTALDDEILDARATDTALTGEAALLHALTANRTGRMRDIVETIQAEQDRVIRAGLSGILVVQGGPGTGKTAVALHRAAYLLYTYREQLSARGVLVLGPNATFLRYISQVLPSLAETGVLLATQGDLFPGVTARRPEPPETAEIKGRATMVEILQAGVRARQRVPEHPVEIVADRHTLSLTPCAVEAARARARDSGLLHNLARPVFDAAVLDALSEQVATLIGDDPFWDDPLGDDDALPGPNLLDAADRADIRADLAGNPAVRRVLDELWPVLTPERFLDHFFADLTDVADLTETAAPEDSGSGSGDAAAGGGAGFTAAERVLLQRAPGGGWTPADVPLLDEAAEILGEDDRAQRAREARDLRARLAYAQGVLDVTAGSKSYELEDDDEAAIPNVADVMEADMLAERLEHREWRSAAERAAADRNWVFGHVIVDEAQELSPMAWRLLMRRCPSRSMTVVGDLAQAGALGTPGQWSEVFHRYVADRWRLAELTVSYRTPAEILGYTHRMLPGITPPRPVRESGVEPWEETGDLDRLAVRVSEEMAALDGGRLAVIAPEARQAELAALLPALTAGEIDADGALLTVTRSKGLEFDTVLVVDPDIIRAESPRGANDLYVALTRPTRRLGVFTLSGEPAFSGGRADDRC
ncbi:HelD family protein [Actinoplanes rectilineatus]|uniref:HelD family protein n=1 Tax=Actinoplanes rectilineatus TaxID=113571 RepID=UPI0005F2E057|nr:ATP-binding domain-containing protein [Actinoplanes rectilineatus]